MGVGEQGPIHVYTFMKTLHDRDNHAQRVWVVLKGSLYSMPCDVS